MKKILSLALVLVMCFVAVASVSAAEWWTIAEKQELTIYKADKAPTIDGVIADDEWGTPTYSFIPADAKEQSDDKNVKSEVPTKAEYWMSYDADNLYLAVRMTTDYYKDGVLHYNSYLIPRFPVSTGSNYRGLVWRNEDGSIYMDGKFASGNAVADVEYKDGVAVYEVAIPKAVMEGGNAAGATGVKLAEGEEWAYVILEYCDQVFPYNEASGDADDGKIFTKSEWKVTLGGEKPAETEKVEDTTKAAETEKAADTTKAAETEKADDTQAPATFDAFVIAAVVAAASAAGIVVSKKRR